MCFVTQCVNKTKRVIAVRSNFFGKAVASFVVALLAAASLGSAATAYPPGTKLSMTIKSIEKVATGTRIGFVVRHAVPGSSVTVNFEKTSKSREANSSGVAVLYFDGPRSGVHIAAATNAAERTSRRVFLPTASIYLLVAAEGRTNYIYVRSAQPGAIVTVKVGATVLTKTVGADYSATVSFTVPTYSPYPVVVSVGSTVIKTFNAESM